MATAAICGFGGSITGTGATEITNWTININVDAQEATSMSSDGWKERIPCLTGASGSFRSIGDHSTVGAHAGCAFRDATVGGITISGDIVISKIDIATPVDGIVSFNHDFSFTGTVTAATLI
jgi:hypothetical protein